jgi:hypothetical protein
MVAILCEILAAHLHRRLAADVAKGASQFGEEAAQVHQQAAVQFGFGMRFGQGQEIQQVGVLELLRSLRLHFSQRR